MRYFDKFLIHHSYTPRDISLEQSVRSFDITHAQRLHPNKNSMGFHIAYHWVIAGDGRYMQTRGLDEIGYHASNWEVNKTSIAACLTGNFDAETPTEAQYQALKEIIECQRKFYKLSLHEHNEYAPKTCPGKNFSMEYLLSLLNNDMTISKETYEYVKNEVVKDSIFNGGGSDDVLTETAVRNLIDIAITRSEDRQNESFIKILMERENITEEQAWEILRKGLVYYSENIKNKQV